MGQPNTRRNYTSMQDWVEVFLIFSATFRKFETETTQVSDAKWIDKKMCMLEMILNKDTYYF